MSHNVREMLGRCLGSLSGRSADDPEVEIVVVDNASTDGSAALVAEEFPGAVLIELEENLGFSAAVNRAATVAGGELFLLLNPDTELSPGTLGAMAESLAAQPRVAALGVRQMDAAGRLQLSVGPEPGILTELGRKLVQKRLDRGGRWTAALLDSRLSNPRAVPWAAASCLLVRREAFESVEGFDEDFFLYWEDVDFCLRLRRAGWQVRYDPTITILHHRGASMAAAPEASEAAYRRSQVLFWQRHGSRWQSGLIRAYLRARGRLVETV